MRKLYMVIICMIIIVPIRAQRILKVQILSDNIIALRNGNDTVSIDISDSKDSVPSVGAIIGIYGDYLSNMWKYEAKFLVPQYGDYFEPDYQIINGKTIETTSKERFHVSGKILSITTK